MAACRPVSPESPPLLDERVPGFVFVPGGFFLMGDRQNPGQPHPVWVPSLHVAVAAYLACVALDTRWWAIRLLGMAYAFVILVASVVLGWHYAVDGYAGALGAWAIWWAVGRWLARAT